MLIHLAEENNLRNVASRGLSYEREALSTLRSLLDKNYKRIIYTSSSTLYGDKSAKQHGIHDKIYIDSPYSRIKSLSEKTVLEHPNGIVVRLANVYGPLMSNTNVISQILSQIHQQGDLEVGDAVPVRDFIWVKDVVDAISTLAIVGFPEIGKPKLYNLGSGIGTSIGDLARMTLELAGQPERHVVSKKQTLVESSIVLDYSETTKACGWVPQVNLREGLENLLRLNFGSGI